MLGPFQAPLTFLLVIAGPPIFRTLATGVKRFLDPKLGGQPKAFAYNPASVEPRRIPHAVFWIVGIHTAAFAYIYYCLQPFNLFTRYFLPVTANARILHSAIHSDETGRASPLYPKAAYQHSSQPGHVATTYLDILAKKLTNSLDNRLLYLRFGHSIFTAAWPRTIPEYMLLKLPEVAFCYLLELGICVFGICNVDWKRKGGYKQSFTWIIILAGMAEVWGRLFWPLMVVEGEAIPVSLDQNPRAYCLIYRSHDFSWTASSSRSASSSLACYRYFSCFFRTVHQKTLKQGSPKWQRSSNKAGISPAKHKHRCRSPHHHHDFCAQWMK